eukprot:2406637-Pleurochrysis_carterae.AAC.1
MCEDAHACQSSENDHRMPCIQLFCILKKRASEVTVTVALQSCTTGAVICKFCILELRRPRS